MNQPAFFLALDAGTGGGRALVFDQYGRSWGRARRAWEYTVSFDVPGASEFDPQVFWRTLVELAREALAHSGIRPDSIGAISASSFRDGSVLLDRAGQPLVCFTNRDGRAAGQAAELARADGELIHRVGGRLPFGLELAEHLLWTREERPQVWARLAHALMVSDWLTWQLCGEYVSEPTNASSSLLLDIRHRKWSREILAALDLSAELLPPLRAPGTVVGTCRAQVAAELGLSPTTPVVIAGGDSPLAALGCGALDPGAVVISAGSSLPVLLIQETPPFDATLRLWSGVHPLPGRWVLESNAGPAGVAYRWARELCYAHENYAVMEAEAARARPGMVHAFLGANLADYSHVDFPRPLAVIIPAVLGFGPTVTRGEFARGVLENIACAAWANVEQLAQMSGQEIRTLHLCGGLTQSELFVQLLANVAGRPVQVSAEHEGAALGAAMCAAVGAGVYPDLRTAAHEMSRARTVEPQTEWVSRYKALYRRWFKTSPQIRALR